MSDGIFRIAAWLEDNLPPFEYFRKIALTISLPKARRAGDLSPSTLLIRLNTHTPWRTISTIQTKRGPPTFFHSDTNPVLGQVLVHSVDKTHVVIVTVEAICLLFLYILSFIFVLSPFFHLCSNTEQMSQVCKIQKKQCEPPWCLSDQSYTTFLVWCALLKVATFLFCISVIPQW